MQQHAVYTETARIARQWHETCLTPQLQAIYLDNGNDNEYEVLHGVSNTAEGDYASMAARCLIHRFDTANPITEINNQVISHYGTDVCILLAFTSL